MITLYDLKQYYKKNNGVVHNTMLSDDVKSILDAKNGERIGPVDKFLEILRSHNHCNFEEIYYCHATLDSVLRCCDCGTVIFASDDCSVYDSKLCCPTCGGYKTSFDFWTKEEVESDPAKQAQIDDMIQEQRERDEEYERMKKRGGLYDHQRWIKKWCGKHRYYEISYICWGWGKKNVKKEKYLEFKRGKKRKSDGHYILSPSKRFPLNFYALYILWILPHTAKFHKAQESLAIR